MPRHLDIRWVDGKLESWNEVAQQWLLSTITQYVLDDTNAQYKQLPTRSVNGKMEVWSEAVNRWCPAELIIHPPEDLMAEYPRESVMPPPDETSVPEDVYTRDQEVKARVEEISLWWSKHARDVIVRTAPKAAEYGAADLDLMGKSMELLFARQLAGATDEEKATFGRYAACAFYLSGKVARIFGALERGKLPNADSEFDAEVYAVMLARIRETGRWV